VPLYEYACPACGARFEKLVRRFGDPVACPACAATDVEKQLSVFAVTTGAPPPLAGCGAAGCAADGGGCGAGACGGGACPLE
jgi:putative FmdB family regulatory protein